MEKTTFILKSEQKSNFLLILPAILIYMVALIFILWRAFVKPGNISEPGTILTLSFVIFIGVFGFFGTMGIKRLSKDLKWIFSNEAFVEQSKIGILTFLWDEIYGFYIDRHDTSLPGTGFSSYLVFEGKKGFLGSSKVQGLNFAAIRNAEVANNVLNEIFLRIKHELIDPRIVLLKHLFEESVKLSQKYTDSSVSSIAFKEAGELKLISAAQKLSKLHGQGMMGSDELMMLAEARFLMKQHKEAMKLCDEVLDKKPTDYWALLCKGLSLWEHRNREEAKKILKKLTKTKFPYADTVSAFLDRDGRNTIG